MRDIRTRVNDGMPVIDIRRAVGETPPEGFTRVDEDGFVDAMAAHKLAYDAWRANNPVDNTDPAPRVVLRSPDRQRWRLNIDNAGNITPQKVTR